MRSEMSDMPVGMSRSITYPYEARVVEPNIGLGWAQDSWVQCRWINLGRRVGRAEIERWNRHEHTVTREIAQVEAGGGDLGRHVGSLVLDLCDQLARCGRVGRRGRELGRLKQSLI